MTAKPSICIWNMFYKLSVYARKVKCLTPGGLQCVEGSTDNGAVTALQKSAEGIVGRTLAAEGLNKSRKVLVGEVFLNGTC